MAFKMNGWSPFSKNGEYIPQTITRKNIDTDIIPQTVKDGPKMLAKLTHGFKVKKRLKKDFFTGLIPPKKK